MTVEVILLGVLATWGLSALLYYWEGFAWLRRLSGVYLEDEHGHSITFWGRQFQCFWCIVIWVSIPVSIAAYFIPWILYPLAMTGGAILLGKGGRIIWRSMTDGES